MRYSSEAAKEVYHSMKLSPKWTFPITALIVDGILQNLVYGLHESHPDWEWESIHMEVEWKILMRESWKGWVKRWVQNIINLWHYTKTKSTPLEKAA